MIKFFLFLPLFLWASSVGVVEKNGFYFITAKNYTFKRINKQRLVLKSKLELMKYLKQKYNKKSLNSITLKGFEVLKVWREKNYGFMLSKVAIKNVKIIDNMPQKQTSQKIIKTKPKTQKIEKFNINKVELNNTKLSDLYILKEIYLLKGDIDKYDETMDKIMDLKFLKDNDENDNFNF